MAAQTMRLSGTTTPNVYQQRGDLEVNQAVRLNNDIQGNNRQLQPKLHEIVGQVGQLQLATAETLRAESQDRLKCIEAKERAVEDRTANASRSMLVKMLGKMIFEHVKQTQSSSQNASESPAARAKKIAEDVILKHESQKTKDLYVFVQSKNCLRLTSGVALAIKDILKFVPNCTKLDLSLFSDQIDKKALDDVLLSNKQITKVDLAK